MLHVTVPVTGLTPSYRRIIRDMVRSEKGLTIKCDRPEGSVQINLNRVLFHADNTVGVVFSKAGSLDDENEEAIIKEKIRELFDVRYY